MHSGDGARGSRRQAGRQARKKNCSGRWGSIKSIASARQADAFPVDVWRGGGAKCKIEKKGREKVRGGGELSRMR